MSARQRHKVKLSHDCKGVVGRCSHKSGGTALMHKQDLHSYQRETLPVTSSSEVCEATSGFENKCCAQITVIKGMLKKGNAFDKNKPCLSMEVEIFCFGVV